MSRGDDGDGTLQATQGLPSSLGYNKAPAEDQLQPSQQMQGYADPSQYFQAQAQAQPQPQMMGQDLIKGLNQAGTQVQSAWPAVHPAGGSGQPSQPGASASGLQDPPSQAAMAGQIYGHESRTPQQSAQGSEIPVNRPAAYSKWAPFHAQPKSQSAGAQPAQAGGATYLTPSEIQTIGKLSTPAGTLPTCTPGWHHHSTLHSRHTMILFPITWQCQNGVTAALVLHVSSDQQLLSSTGVASPFKGAGYNA